MKQRFFTVEEARQLLPSIKDLVGKTVALATRLEGYQEAVKKLADIAPLNAGSAEGTAYLQDLILLQNFVARIQENGCLVKSVQDGLVDFPHLKEGREVYLCWKYGEDNICFWHEVDSGFSSRIPLSE